MALILNRRDRQKVCIGEDIVLWVKHDSRKYGVRCRLFVEVGGVREVMEARERERFVIRDQIVVWVEHKFVQGHRHCRVFIEAPRDVRIQREEIRNTNGADSPPGGSDRTVDGTGSLPGSGDSEE